MESLLFLRGLVFGLAVAIPVGPIGLLCMRRTLVQGLCTGLATGMGAASADAAYGVIVAVGFEMVSTMLLSIQPWLAAAGGLYLLWLGIAILNRQTDDATLANTPVQSLFGAYLSAGLLTLANPMTITVFAALILTTGADIQEGEPLLLVLGVFSGSLLWWCLLSLSVAAVRHRLGARWQRRLDLLSGIILLSFGLLALLDSAMALLDYRLGDL